MAVAKLKKSMSYDIYQKTREWPYSNMKKKVFAETYMQDEDKDDLCDYKFFCFNGRVLYCQVIANRNTDETIAFYNRDWVKQEFYGLNPEARQSKEKLQKPSVYDEMLAVADKLCGIAPFMRVDLYCINGRAYFGEMTFYPNSGTGRFEPTLWNEHLGNLLKLPN